LWSGAGFLYGRIKEQELDADAAKPLVRN